LVLPAERASSGSCDDGAKLPALPSASLLRATGRRSSRRSPGGGRAARRLDKVDPPAEDLLVYPSGNVHRAPGSVTWSSRRPLGSDALFFLNFLFVITSARVLFRNVVVGEDGGAVCPGSASGPLRGAQRAQGFLRPGDQVRLPQARTQVRSPSLQWPFSFAMLLSFM
jgi:hypothetical protein